MSVIDNTPSGNVIQNLRIRGSIIYSGLNHTVIFQPQFA